VSTMVRTLIDLGGSPTGKRAEETKSFKNNGSNSPIGGKMVFED
jgi:hypothetical protein